MEDEQKLRAIFWQQSRAHDTFRSFTNVGVFLAYWPILYSLSARVKPFGCFAFTLGYGFVHYNGVLPFLNGRLQSSLNSSAVSFADKYKIKSDKDYLR